MAMPADELERLAVLLRIAGPWRGPGLADRPDHRRPRPAGVPDDTEGIDGTRSPAPANERRELASRRGRPAGHGRMFGFVGR